MTKVTAPGKVLITGGYLVLDPRFAGLVMAVDARFRVTISDNNEPASEYIHFKVLSPQFTDGGWIYTYLADKLAPIGRTNSFIEVTLRLVLQFLQQQGCLESMRLNYSITIEADNDFYSQLPYLRSYDLESNYTNLSKLPKYNLTGGTLSQVKKTGLGSSAAMTTALTFALLTHFKYAGISPEVVTKLAQCCHCSAQGKIGSGFDISAAVYGSHSYNRFNPSLLEASADLISQTVLKTWDYTVKPFQLPPGFIMQLGDISTGSNTPKMVSRVLAWRNENLDSCELIWHALNTHNLKVEACFEALQLLSLNNSEAYLASFAICSQLSHSDWLAAEGVDLLFAKVVKTLSVTFREIRRLLKDMGIQSGVEIEPDSQTELLNRCSQVPGVLIAGVPGAGGYDAIFCIMFGEIAKERLLDTWQESVTPLLASVTEQGLAHVPHSE